MSPSVYAFTTVLALAATHSALAALLPADDSNFGPGSLTVSTGQQLNWLAPRFTAGLSFVEVQALLATDPRFQQYRVATTVELGGLYFEAGIPDVNVPGPIGLYGTEGNVPSVLFLQSLVGTSYSVMIGGTLLTEVSGFVGSTYFHPNNGLLSIDIGNTVVRTNVVTFTGPATFASAYTSWASLPVGTGTEGVGTWLVSTVPEPSGGALLFLGLAMLSLHWRRVVA